MNIVIKGYKRLPKGYNKRGWLMQDLVQDVMGRSPSKYVIILWGLVATSTIVVDI